MRILLPLAATVLALAACDNSAPPPAAPIITESPSPPPAPTGPYYATPAPGEELPTSQTTPGPIPLEYRHVWAIAAEDCAADPSLTRIAIAPGAIRFHESRAVVSSADASRPGTLTLVVDHSTEGQTSRETHTLSLDATGKTLTYSRNDTSFTYVRCD